VSDYAKITAIIRVECLATVERALKDHGVSGVSISRVKGYGEYTDFFSQDWMSTHVRVEVITGAAGAATVADTILDAACTGTKGDGLVAITPIDRVWRVRTKTVVPPSEL
jgi:nitrogen regulatory protein P-II 1